MWYCLRKKHWRQQNNELTYLDKIMYLSTKQNRIVENKNSKNYIEKEKREKRNKKSKELGKRWIESNKQHERQLQLEH